MTMTQERMKVVIRGVVYESVAEAARALGVKPVTIYSSLSRGSIDRVGLGKGNHKRTPGKSGGRPRPLTIGGVTYPTMEAASLALGFSKSYVRQAIRLKRGSSIQKVIAASMKMRAQQESEARLKAEKREL